MNETDRKLAEACARWAREQREWWGEGADALAIGVTALSACPGLPERVSADGALTLATLAAATMPGDGRCRLAAELSGVEQAAPALERMKPFFQLSPDTRGSMALGMLIAMKESLPLTRVR